MPGKGAFHAKEIYAYPGLAGNFHLVVKLHGDGEMVITQEVGHGQNAYFKGFYSAREIASAGRQTRPRLRMFQLFQSFQNFTAIPLYILVFNLV